MGKSIDWKQAALVMIGLIVGVPIAVWFGVYSFLSTNTTVLYPNTQSVPSVSGTGPLAAWTGAVERGRKLARAGIVEKNLPGLSVAVGVGNDIVWAEGFGWADLEKQVRVSPTTRFRIGHVSKALTSAAVGVLREKGRMRLGDEIQTYVPGFPRKEWPITLRQLMGHVAGVRHYESEADYTISSHCERASEGLSLFADDPLRFEPDTQYRYSTYGWILVSAAVEAAANEPFFSFMRSQIFTPLGMTGTSADSAKEPLPDLATFYYPRFSGDTAYGPQLATPVDYSCFAGAGGFLSTPSDLVRFGLAMNNGKLLPSIRVLQTTQVLASGDETAYGLGWMLETVSLGGEPTRQASHASVTLLGGSTSFLTFPERGLVVAVTSNISKANTTSIAHQIAEAFAERE